MRNYLNFQLKVIMESELDDDDKVCRVYRLCEELKERGWSDEKANLQLHDQLIIMTNALDEKEKEEF